MIVLHGKAYTTPKAAAVLFRISLSTIYGWCTTGKVELFDGSELDTPLGPKSIKDIYGSKYLISIDSIKRRLEGEG